MASSRKQAAILAVGGACLFALACLDPTEVVVHVTTDTVVLCDRLAGVDFSVGGNQVASKTSPPCKDKEVGSINFVPSRSADERFTLLVTGRMKTSTSTVKATRVVGFVAHSKLELGIVLEESCVDVACKSDETCLHGACVPADVGCGKDRTCTLDAGAGEGGAGEAGVLCSVVAPIDQDRKLRAVWHFDEPAASMTTTSSAGDKATVQAPAAIVPDAPTGCGGSLEITTPAVVSLLPTFASPNGVHVSLSVKRMIDAPATLVTQLPPAGVTFTWKLVVNQDGTLGVVTAAASYSSMNVKLPADLKWHRVDLVWGALPTLAVDGATTTGPATMPYPGAGGALNVGFGMAGISTFRVDELHLFSQ